MESINIKNKKVIIVGIIIIILFFSLLFIINHCFEKKWHIKYNITNFAGIEDSSSGLGLSYENTFKVSGTIELKNYKTDMIAITADAIDKYGRSVHIFTAIKINGNGLYNFEMTSFYRNGVELIVDIINIKVKEA